MSSNIVAAWDTGIPADYTKNKLGIMNAKRELRPIIKILVTYSESNSIISLLIKSRVVKQQKPIKLQAIANCIDVAFFFLSKANNITPIKMVKLQNISSSTKASYVVFSIHVQVSPSNTNLSLFSFYSNFV